MTNNGSSCAIMLLSLQHHREPQLMPNTYLDTKIAVFRLLDNDEPLQLFQIWINDRGGPLQLFQIWINDRSPGSDQKHDLGIVVDNYAQILLLARTRTSVGDPDLEQRSGTRCFPLVPDSHSRSETTMVWADYLGRRLELFMISPGPRPSVPCQKLHQSRK